MALNLLERVRDKALSALQGAGNFIQQDFQRSPLGQGIEGFSSLLQGRAPTPPPPPPIDFGSILKNVIDYQAKQPIIPALGKFSPSTGQALNTAADFTYRPVARIGFEGAQTLAGDKKVYTPQSDLEKLFLGSAPLRNYGDPDRPGRQFAKGIGHEELAPLFIGAGVALDAVPVNPAKILGKGGIKVAAKSASSLDDFVRLLTKDKKLAQEATAIFKDAKNPINTVEQLFAKYGPTAGKKTAEVIKEGKRIMPKVEEVILDASKPGNIFKRKGAPRKLFEDLFRSSKGVIGRAGPAGQEIVTRLDNAEEEASLIGGAATARLQAALKSLKGSEIDTFADVVEGTVKAVSKKQKQAVKVWKEIADDVFKRAKEAGVNVKERRNYFPHQISELSKADKKVFVQQMVASGKYKTEAEALQALEKQVGGALGQTAERRFGNLELARDTELPYNKSPNVLFDYVDNAYNRISDARHFGKNDEELYKLARAAGTQGGDPNQIVKYLDQILGKNQTPSKLAQKLTSLQTITKLNPVTSAVNLTQNLSTWLRTDTATMTKTMGQVIKNPTKAFENATKVGEISPSMAKELQDYVGTGNAANKWIRLIGMRGTEKFNRVMAVNAGINYGEKLAKQAAGGSAAAIRELDRFGITLKDINKKGELAVEALQKIGRQVSGETQFSTKAGELPYFWRTNVGKVVTQFKSFAYKQTGFTKDTIKRVGSETAKGNFKPLVNALVVYGISAPIAGEIVNDWRALVRNKEREDADSLTERYFSNILAASSFGLLDSTGGLLGEYGMGGTISTIGGPSVGDAQKLFQAAGDAGTGLQNGEGPDPYLRTTRNLIKEIPGVGPTIANTVVPNSFVDNLNIPGTDINLGVNDGLDKDNSAIYDQLKSSDPSAAALFQKENKAINQEEKGGILGLFGGGKKSGGNDIVWKDESGKTQSISLLEKETKGTGDPDDISKYKEGTSNASKAIKLFGAPADQVPDEVKTEAFKKLGYEYDDVRYAYKSSFTVDEKTSYIMDKNMDHDELVQALATGRVESISGDYFASNGVLDNLYEEGLISKEERAYLKKIKIGKDGKLATSSIQGTGLSASKIKSFINSVNSLYKDPLSEFTPATGKKASKRVPEAKIPKAPKLNLSIKGGKKSQSQWFTA